MGAPTVVVAVVRLSSVAALHGPAAEQAWTLYETAFTPLAAQAIQRHLLDRKEFAEIGDDRRIGKHLAHDGDDLVGLATLTNHLEAWPLISPPYFQARWPDLYRSRRIWWCGFVAVPEHRPGVFADLVTAMWKTAADAHGVVGIDVCWYNDQVRHLSRSVRALLTRLAGHRVTEVSDVQTFRVFETWRP